MNRENNQDCEYGSSKRLERSGSADRNGNNRELIFIYDVYNKCFRTDGCAGTIGTSCCRMGCGTLTTSDEMAVIINE